MKFANFVEFWHFGHSLEVKLLTLKIRQTELED